MSFTTQPNLEVAEQGILANQAVPTTAAIATKPILSRPYSSGLVFTIFAPVAGNFVINYVDFSGNVRTLQGTTAYTANTFVTVNFAYFVRKAYVVFTPTGTSASNLVIEAFSYGRGV
jgi:hypothetical protein